MTKEEPKAPAESKTVQANLSNQSPSHSVPSPVPSLSDDAEPKSTVQTDSGGSSQEVRNISEISESSISLSPNRNILMSKKEDSTVHTALQSDTQVKIKLIKELENEKDESFVDHPDLCISAIESKEIKNEEDLVTSGFPGDSEKREFNAQETIEILEDNSEHLSTVEIRSKTVSRNNEGEEVRSVGTSDFAADVNVRFVKSCAPKQDYYPYRDIFEEGGEVVLDPHLDLSRRPILSEENEIEYLPEESPEPRVTFTPAFSSESDPSASPRMRLRAIYSRFKQYCVGLWQKTLKLYCKAPVFYFFSICTIAFSSDIISRSHADYDFFICAIIAAILCIFITFGFRRGQWSHHFDRLDKDPCPVLYDRENKRIAWNACCAPGRESDEEPENAVVRHSRYHHLEEEQDTNFEHEISDVTNIQPSDCPQMKMVEQEQDILHDGSPDYLPEVSQVNVDVHISEVRKNSEKFDAVPKPRGVTSRSSPVKPPCSVKRKSQASIDGPFGKTESRVDVSKSAPPKLSSRQNDNVEVSEAADDNVEFICEHYGQGVACSCALIVRY